jgi:protein-disulfide isomerase
MEKKEEAHREHAEHHEHHEKKSDRWMFLSIALLVVLCLSIASNFIFMGKLNAYVGPPKVAYSYNSSAGFIGKANAPVALVMYTDFQCPYCAKWYTETFPQIKENFIDTGIVKFYVKYFPLSFHSNAKIAANAAACAKEQGYFLDYEAKLYANQGALDRTSLIGYATSLGADETKFTACLDESRYQDAIDADQAEGSAAGITGTPGFTINGVDFPVGASPYSTFEPELNKAAGK